MFRIRLLVLGLCLFAGLAGAPRANAQVPSQAQSQSQALVASPQTDINKISDEALVWLQDLIRINTSNPPGNEIVAAKYVAALLQ
ncbi:MAG: hypothetical protein WAK91_16915, partial [Candidatus Acidiferrales bacterium]